MNAEASTLDLALALIHTRQNVLPKRLVEPGPTRAMLQLILGAGAAAPDHKELQPWRFVIVPQEQRVRLAEVFAAALLERDSRATPAQVEQAREKAFRAPFSMLAIARLSPHGLDREQDDTHHSHGESSAADVTDAERLVSLGCAIQNMVLAAHAAGFGTGLTSGLALRSRGLRELFSLQAHEHAVCCINLGSVSKSRTSRVRPTVDDYVSVLRK
jgi:nitroreductase